MAPAAKKAKLDNEDVSDVCLDEMLKDIAKSRSATAKDISEFNFNKKRVRLLTGNEGKLQVVHQLGNVTQGGGGRRGLALF